MRYMPLALHAIGSTCLWLYMPFLLFCRDDRGIPEGLPHFPSLLKKKTNKKKFGFTIPRYFYFSNLLVVPLLLFAQEGEGGDRRLVHLSKGFCWH